MNLTEEELSNLKVLVDAGARAISAQSDLEKAAGILAFAFQITKKLSDSVKKDES